jgi:glycerol-3-phosphate dehydrogenase
MLASPAAQTSRLASLAALRENLRWDLLVIGGGATGLGLALDAAARGLKVACLESHDFAQGTSSRATKLVHGGVRYLAQGNIGLVREALHERATLLANAPHLAQPLPFVMPAYRLWELPFYGAGLKAYDALACPPCAAPACKGPFATGTHSSMTRAWPWPWPARRNVKAPRC